jgi:hypothetical protein
MGFILAPLRGFSRADNFGHRHSSGNLIFNEPLRGFSVCAARPVRSEAVWANRIGVSAQA